MKRNLSIIGYYTSNFGDLLMLKGLIRAIPKEYSRLFILSYGKLDLEALGEIGLSNKTITVIDLSNKKKHLISILHALFTTKSIVWGGGTCFNVVENAFGGIRYMRVFHFFGARIYYMGIGINTNRVNNTLCESIKYALQISNSFNVRDRESQMYINSEIDSSFSALVPDLVYLNDFSPQHRCNKVLNGDRVVFVSYRCIDTYFNNSKEYLNGFIKNLTYLLNHLAINRVIIYPSDEVVDYDNNIVIATELNKVFLGRVSIDFYEHLTINDVLGVINNSFLVITGRLHVGVVSSVFGTPFLLLNYSSKNRAFIQDACINTKSLVEYNELKDETQFYSNSIELLKDRNVCNYVPSNIDILVNCTSSIMN